MLFQTALVGGLLLAGHAAATVDAILERSNDIEETLRRDAAMIASLTRRQDPNPMAASQNMTLPTPEQLAKWDADTKAACMSSLMGLKQASNPSGMAVCYNLPLVDNSTGFFEAELRMYNVSAPIDVWSGIQASQVSMTLQYDSATVSAVNGSLTAKRSITWPAIRDVDDSLVKRQSASTGPTEMKTLFYVGQLNMTVLNSAKMSQAALETFLTPRLKLSAMNTALNQMVETTLSLDEASFVNGVFSKQAASTTANFQLPGTNLAFFPIGLVITCIWTGGFIAAVGLGTMGRIQFREQYRRRLRSELSRGNRTI